MSELEKQRDSMGFQMSSVLQIVIQTLEMRIEPIEKEKTTTRACFHQPSSGFSQQDFGWLATMNLGSSTHQTKEFGWFWWFQKCLVFGVLKQVGESDPHQCLGS